jgi:CMP-N,N'-diacetyllegionaminic acid synthase
VTVLCTICARGGSQGVPGKNIRPLLGKPLIAWTVEQALATPEIDHVMVSTDSPAIAEAARAAGADCFFLRPAALADGASGKFQVWQHALAEAEKHYGTDFELFVDLDVTCPMKEASDVSAAIAQYRAGRARGVDAVFSVCRARKNPYFNLVEPDASGALKVSKPLPGKVLARQAAPPVFEHIAAIYVMSPAYLKRADFLLDGHTEGYDLGEWKGLDIDTEADFIVAEALMRARKEHQL